MSMATLDEMRRALIEHMDRLDMTGRESAVYTFRNGENEVRAERRGTAPSRITFAGRHQSAAATAIAVAITAGWVALLYYGLGVSIWPSVLGCVIGHLLWQLFARRDRR